jgi:hypothetical protein
VLVFLAGPCSAESDPLYAFVTRLSRVVIAGVLVLSAADVSAQTLTANGTTGAFSIYRGDSVTITTSGALGGINLQDRCSLLQ